MGLLDALKKRRDGETPRPATEKPDEPEDLCLPWEGDMVLRRVGSGERVDYPLYSSATERLQWVSRKTDGEGRPLSVRDPEERTHTFPVVSGFVAAGKWYASLKLLTVKTDANGLWCRDVYGREVLAVRERFPCFDSEDFLHEDRYYRWFLLREGGKLTRVYHTDERPTVTVTEDVRDLEPYCWEMVQREHFAV